MKTMETIFMPAPLHQEDFETIRSMVYEAAGINLTAQKKVMVESRLTKRLKQIGCRDFRTYIKLVTREAQEKAIFINLITTNVTHFFREPHHFDFLKSYLSNYTKKVGPKKILKFWSAGCSTGQEPYSLAITLAEHFQKQPGDFTILASDINTEVLQKAHQGIYPIEEVEDIHYALLKSYFKMGQGSNRGLFKVKDCLQDKITFKKINLIDNTAGLSSEQAFDFIFCRNVFIYFDQETKKRIIRKFYDKLRPGGCLFLGHSESLNTSDPSIGNWMSLQHTVYLRQ